MSIDLERRHRPIDGSVGNIASAKECCELALSLLPYTGKAAEFQGQMQKGYQ